MKCLEIDSEDKIKLLFKESLYHTHTNVPFHQANSQHDQLCPLLILTIKQHDDKTPPSLILAKLLNGKIKVYDNIKTHSVNFIVNFFLLKLSWANMQFQSMDFITISSSTELF